jgi:mRNA-degrading endonuclease toxin of MazEF toxin-antitoxin module
LSAYRRGQIVRAVVPDPQGRNPKARPCVVVSPAPGIDGSLALIGITGELSERSGPDWIDLPYHNGDPHPRTGLSKESAALCTWQIVVAQEDIIGPMGTAPAAQLARILHRLTELFASRDKGAQPAG